VETEIKILIVDHKNGIMIRVTDNGIGISRNSVDKVFDMFYKASLLSKGRGLGLYLVKNSVEKLEGEVNLSSEEGVGTMVQVILPSLALSPKLPVQVSKHTFLSKKPG
jgi:signal transduction histidine kinase